VSGAGDHGSLSLSLSSHAGAWSLAVLKVLTGSQVGVSDKQRREANWGQSALPAYSDVMDV